MPKIDHNFLEGPLKWEILSGGAKNILEDGVSTGVDLDGTAAATGQAYSEIFTIGPMPDGAEGHQWDKIEFDFIYQHVNWVARSRYSDQGNISVWICDENGEKFDVSLIHREMLKSENSAAGRFYGEFTAAFHNLSPGKYRLFVGEMDKGDGEPLRLQVRSGVAIEVVPDPVSPSVLPEEVSLIDENSTPTSVDKIIVNPQRRHFEEPPPPTNGNHADVPCFTRGTNIETRDGPMMIEALRKGTLIRTRGRGWQPIRWIGSQKLSAADLYRNPHLYPIRIKAGALGVQTPCADLTISPQHRILVRSKPAQRMFGTNEILIAAKHLLNIEGVEIVFDQEELEYFHFMFEQHEIVVANGAETESFYTGEQALKSVGEAAFAEISQIFSHLKKGNPMLPAVPFATGRRARQLIHRHVKNRLELVSQH